MPRPSFSVSLQGSGQKWISAHTGYPPSATSGWKVSCSETIGGPAARRKPEGWLPPLPYNFERRYQRRQEGLFEEVVYDLQNNGQIISHKRETGVIFNKTPNQMFEHTGTTFTGWTPRPTNAEIDQALVKARVKMKRQDLNLGVAFAERNRTAQLLGDTASQLARALIALRRGKWRDCGRILGMQNVRKPRGHSIPQKWLEFQYGWTPLLSDVYGATAALTKQPASDWRVTGKGKVRFEWEDEFDHVNGANGPNDSLTGVTRAKLERGVFVRIDAIPQNDLLQAFTSLGLTNPALIAWELVPFSFVVDWALPIGQFLDSLDAMLGYGPTDCSISQYGKLVGRWTGGGDSWISGNRYKNVITNQGSMYYEHVYMRRTVSKTVPLPTLPRLRDPRSLTRMANGLSLLATAFGRRR